MQNGFSSNLLEHLWIPRVTTDPPVQRTEAKVQACCVRLGLFLLSVTLGSGTVRLRRARSRRVGPVTGRGSCPECLRNSGRRAVRGGVDQRRQGDTLGRWSQQCLADDLNIGVRWSGGCVAKNCLGWIQNGRKGLVHSALVMIAPTGRQCRGKALSFRCLCFPHLAVYWSERSFRSVIMRPSRDAHSRPVFCFGLALGGALVRYRSRMIHRRHAVEQGLIRDGFGGTD